MILGVYRCSGSIYRLPVAAELLYYEVYKTKTFLPAFHIQYQRNIYMTTGLVNLALTNRAVSRTDLWLLDAL